MSNSRYSRSLICLHESCDTEDAYKKFVFEIVLPRISFLCGTENFILRVPENFTWTSPAGVSNFNKVHNFAVHGLFKKYRNYKVSDILCTGTDQF